MEEHWESLVAVAVTRESCVAIEAIQARVAELEHDNNNLRHLRDAVEGQAGQSPESLSIRVRYALKQCQPKDRCPGGAMPRTLKTEAGSTVTFDNLRVRVDFDWFEEPNACIDCEVDVDLSTATGWKHLMWRCEADENHDLAYARLSPVNP